MGLFDKLAKQGLAGLKDKIEEAAGVDLDAPLEKLKNTLEDLGGSVTQSVKTAESDIAERAAVKAEAPTDVTEHFRGILTSEFSGYEVKEKLGAGDAGLKAQGNEKPYDFALFDGGKLCGVIMLTPHNRDNNAAFRNAKAAVIGAGVPFINFYTHYPNERGYVVDRIKSFL